MKAFVISCNCKRIILLEEMFPDKPTKMQAIDSLMHSSVDIDQMIVFEVNLIEDSFEQGTQDNQTIKLSLFRIKGYAEDNSRKVREARNIARKME
jgi:hypothetical protein